MLLNRSLVRIASLIGGLLIGSLLAGAAGAKEAGEQLVIPDKPAEIWQAVHEHVQAMEALVAGSDLEEVHHHALAVKSLVAELSKRSAGTDPAARKKFRAYAGYVATLAERLDETGDANDIQGTEANLRKLKGILEKMKGLSLGRGGSAAAGMRSHGAHAHMQRPTGLVDTPARETVRVRAFDRLRFEPERVVVKAGVPTRIELENIGATEHALVVKTPDGRRDWVHLHVLPGATKGGTYEFDVAGTFPLSCTIPGHAEGGMVGELVVLGTGTPKGDSGSRL